MKNIEVSDEIFNGLMQIATDLTNQDHRGTAMPYIFQVKEDRRVFDHNCNGDELIFIWNYSNEYPYTLKGLKDLCKDMGVICKKSIQESFSSDSYAFDSWLTENSVIKSSYTIEHNFSNAFITENACKKHINSNKHHYNNPSDYLSFGTRNPELEVIFKFLCGLDGKEIHK